MQLMKDIFNQKCLSLESTYLYREIFIKQKAGFKLLSLEKQNTAFKAQARINQDRVLMELNDLRSSMQEQQAVEDKLLAENNNFDIEDLPSAIAKIEALRSTSINLEKKLRNSERAVKSLRHRMNVTGMTNTELHSQISILKMNLMIITIG